MLPEHWLLYVEFNIFNSIVGKKRCVIIVTKVVLISERIVTQLSGYPKVGAHCVGHFIQHSQ
jgi:hypothetical protein